MLNANPACRNMIQQQIRTWGVLDPQIIRLFASCPRELFVPANLKSLAYADTELPIGHGQVTLQPSVIGKMLAELQLKGSETVLEIGTGTGFVTALLAKLCKSVTSVELYKQLVIQAISKLSSLKLHNVEILEGNAVEILRSNKAFDVVILTGSVQDIPKIIANQTKYHGQLFAIIGKKPVMQACIFTRINEETWSKRTLFETVIPPLEGIEIASGFKL